MACLANTLKFILRTTLNIPIADNFVDSLNFTQPELQIQLTLRRNEKGLSALLIYFVCAIGRIQHIDFECSWFGANFAIDQQRLISMIASR